MPGMLAANGPTGMVQQLLENSILRPLALPSALLLVEKWDRGHCAGVAPRGKKSVVHFS